IGPFNAVPAGFGSVQGPCDSDDIVGSYKLVTDASGLTTACDTITEDLSGMIVLIDRGGCEFGRKALWAEQAGAAAVIVCNNNADAPFPMAGGAFGGEVTIPAFMISQADCAAFRDVAGTITLSPAGVEFDPRDIVLWGAGGEGNFDSSLDGWTTENYVACAADTLEGFSLWQWRPAGGSNRGAFVGGAGSVNSPTSCNGVASFDSDFYDNDGISGNFGAGPCAASQAGALISPSIDLSGSADAAGVAVTFYQALRQFQSTYWVGWSTDGGVTWDSTQINQEYEVNSPHIQDIERVNLPSSVIGASDLRIKFTLSPANYYYWTIDDVRIVEREANNLRVNNFFALPPNAITPQSQVEAFGFLADIENIGALAQDEVNLNMTIVNSEGSVVFTDDLGYGTIISDSLAENQPFAETFTPTEIGLYQGTYTVSANGDDFDEGDN
ncbi:MAG: PA domain-containing protein, partial [Bacteroidota bacterium]